MDGYAFPVYVTDLCPRNSTEWRQRSLSLNCTETNGYTCIPNEDFTKLLQFCYTDLRIRIQKGMCLFLYRHNSLVDAMSCRTFMKGCPDVSYFSDEIFKYQSCLSIRNGCFLADPLCDSTSENLTTLSTISDRDSLDKEHQMLIWMLTLLVYVIVAILFGGIYLYRKNKVNVDKRRKTEGFKKTKKSVSKARKTDNPEEKVSTKWNASIDYFLQDVCAINHLFTNNRIQQFSTMIEIRKKSLVKLPVSNALKLNYNEQEITGRLCIACFREKNCYVLHLEKEEINCDLTEELEASPLFVASLNLQIESFQDFLTKSTLKIKCKENQTNCFCKVSKNQIDKVVCYILKNSTHFRITKGASSDYPDSSGPDEFDRVITFLMDNGVQINGCSINGSTLLGIACEHGFDDTAQKLLSCGADVEFCNENGDSPLHCACKNGHSNIVELLLNKNVDINMCNNDAESPLLIGCQNGFESLVKILLENGANVNLCKVNNISPLYAASRTGHEGIVKLLIENEADVNLCNTNGAGPLSVACQNGHFSIVELLLSKQQDVNVCMKDGKSPLFMACHGGHISCAQLLLNAGAATQVSVRKAVSPLYIACQNGHYGIVKLLIHFGVDKTICMQTKPNPIKIASDRGHNNIVQLLMEHCHTSF